MAHKAEADVGGGKKTTKKPSEEREELRAANGLPPSKTVTQAKTSGADRAEKQAPTGESYTQQTSDSAANVNRYEQKGTYTGKNGTYTNKDTDYTPVAYTEADRQKPVTAKEEKKARQIEQYSPTGKKNVVSYKKDKNAGSLPKAETPSRVEQHYAGHSRLPQANPRLQGDNWAAAANAQTVVPDMVFNIEGRRVTARDLIAQGYPLEMVKELEKMYSYSDNNTPRNPRMMSEVEYPKYSEEASYQNVIDTVHGLQDKIATGNYADALDEQNTKAKFNKWNDAYQTAIYFADDKTLEQDIRRMEKYLQTAENSRKDKTDELIELSMQEPALAGSMLNEMSGDVAWIRGRLQELQSIQKAKKWNSLHDNMTPGDKKLFMDLYDYDTGTGAVKAGEMLSNVASAMTGSGQNSVTPDGTRDQGRIELYNKLKAKGYTAEDYELYNAWRNVTAAQKLYKTVGEFVDKNRFNEAIATAASVLSAPARGISNIIGDIATDGHGRNYGEVLSEFSKAATGSIVENIEDRHPGKYGKAMGKIYQWSVSAAESALMAAVGSATGVPYLTEMLFGMNATADTYDESLARGLDNTHAAATAFVSGLAEVLFEHLSIEKIKLFSDKVAGTGGKAFLINWVKSFIPEGSEEGATSLANEIADLLINGEMSNYSQALANGYTPGEYAKQFGKSLIDDVIGGMFSGGAMFMATGGGSALRTNTRNAVKNIVAGRDIANKGDVTQVIDAAKLSENKRTQRLGEKLEGKQQKGKTAATLTGRVYNRVQNENIYDAAVEAARQKGETDAKKLDAIGTAAVESRTNLRVDKETGNLVYTLDPGAAEAVKDGVGAEVMEELNGSRRADWAERLRQSEREFAVSTGAATDRGAVATRMDERIRNSVSAVREAIDSGKSYTLVENGFEGQLSGDKGQSVTIGGITGTTADGKIELAVDSDAKTGTQATAVFDADGAEGTVRSTDEAVNVLLGRLQEAINGEVVGETTEIGGKQMNTGVPMTVEAANAAIAEYDPTVNPDVDSYFDWRYDAFKAGLSGISFDEYFRHLKRGRDAMRSKSLTLEQLRSAWRMGAAAFSPKPGVTRIGTATMTTEQATQLAIADEIAKANNQRVVVVDSLDVENGFYTADSGVIVVALDSEFDLILRTVFEETYHQVRNELGSEASIDFVDETLDYFAADKGMDAVDEALDQVARIYTGRSYSALISDNETKESTVLKVREEVAAQYFAGLKARDMTEFAQSFEGKRTFLQKLRDALRSVLDTIHNWLKNMAGEDAIIRSAMEAKEETIHKVLKQVDNALEQTRETREQEVANRGEQVKKEAWEGAESAGETMNSLKRVKPVQPTSDTWQRSLTTDEAMERFPNLWNVAADESETRNPTQVQGTISTYRKIYDILKAEGFNGTILDASSGLGYGTRAGIEEYGFDVEDIEPYPSNDYHPKYKDYSKLNKKYDVIISNAVLNVLPQDQRDAITKKMGELLNEGGRIFINVRGDDVLNASSLEVIDRNSLEVYISKSGSYQKGFTKPELKAYLQDALGDGFTVENTNKFSKISAVVTKTADVMYSKRREVLALKNVDWMDGQGIREQLVKHKDEISKLNPVAIVNYGGETKTDLENLIMEQVKKVGGERFVRNGISFKFDGTGIHHIRKHTTNDDERAAAIAAPYVAKRGALIAGHKKHDGQNNTTLTYAAPVIINGEEAHVGVVIQFTNDGRAHAVNVEFLSGNTNEQKKKSARGQRSRSSKSEVTGLLTNADLIKYGITQKEKSQAENSDTDLNGISVYDEATDSVAPDNRMSSLRVTPQQDADYMAAVERGDTEEAQRMVDEAAKAAGYDTPKLYHGTGAFGFTEFDLDKGEHAIFASSNLDVAKTYVGETDRMAISERATENIDALKGEALLARAKKQFPGEYDGYYLVSQEEKNDDANVARNKLRTIAKKAVSFKEDFDGAFNTEKEQLFDSIVAALGEIAEATDGDELLAAKEKYENLMWDLKWMDESIQTELSDAIGQQLNYVVRDLDTALYQGDLYRNAESAMNEKTIFDNQLALELDAAIHKGVYQLYGKMEHPLEIDAKGANWNDIREWIPNVTKKETRVRPAGGYYELVEKRTGNILESIKRNDTIKSWSTGKIHELLIFKATEKQRIMNEGPKTTRFVSTYAFNHGYDSVVIRNLRDVSTATDYRGTGDVYIFNAKNAVKSADPITYDDDGNVIPLSERFNEKKEDIRYSLRRETVEERIERTVLENDELKQMKRETEKLLKETRKQLDKATFDAWIAGVETGGRVPLRNQLMKTVAKYNDAKLTGVSNEALTNRIVENLIDMEKNDYAADVLTNLLWGTMYDKAMGKVETLENETRDIIREHTKGGRFYVSDSAFDDLVDMAGSRRALNSVFRSVYGFTMMPESEAKSKQMTEAKGANGISHFNGSVQAILDDFPNVFAGSYYETLAEDGDPFSAAAALWEMQDAMQVQEVDAEEAYGAETVFEGAMAEAANFAEDIIRLTPIRTVADKYVQQMDELRQSYEGKLARQRRTAEKQLTSQKQYYMNLRREASERNREQANKTRYYESIVKNVRWLNDRITRADKDRHVPYALREAVQPFIDYFLNNSNVFTSKQTQKLIDWYKRLDDAKDGSNEGLDYADRIYYGMYIEDVADLLEELKEAVTKREETEAEGETKRLRGGKKTDRLTAEEMKTVRDVMKALRHLITQANSVYVQGKRINYQEAGQSLWSGIRSALKTGTAADIKKKIANKTLLVGMVKPVYMFREIIGGEMTKYFDDIREAQNRYAFRLVEADNYLTDLDKKYDMFSWFDDTDTFTLDSGVKITLDKDAEMQIYATHRREMLGVTKTNHLIGAGIELSDYLMKLNKKTDKAQYEALQKQSKISLTEKDLQRIMNSLTDQQKGFADAVVKFMSTTCSAWGNEVSRELAGFDNFTEPYYFPYVISGNYLYQPVGGRQENIRLKNSGITKALKNNASKTIAVTGFMDVAAKHIGTMANYSTLTVPLENLQRVRNFIPEGEEGSVQTEIGKVYGAEIAGYINNFLRDANGGARQAADIGWGKFISLFKRSSVALNMSVFIQQYSAVVRAMAMVDPKYFVPRSHMLTEYKELMKWSGVAIIKELGGWDINTGRSTVDFLTHNDGRTARERINNRLDNFTGWLPGQMDRFGWSTIWNAVKRETAKEMGVKYRRKGMTDEFYRAAAKRFNDVVDYTQVYDSTLSRSQNMRIKDGQANMLTAFAAEPITSYNLLMFSGMKKNGKTINKGAAIAAFTGSVILNTFLTSIVKAVRSKDDEPWIERMLKYWFEGIAGEEVQKLYEIFDTDSSNKLLLWLGHFLTSELNPINFIVGVKDVITLLQGWDVERSDMTVFSDTLKGITNTFKALNGLKEDEDADLLSYADALLPLLTSLSNFTHLPLKSAYKDFWLATKNALARKDKAMTLEGVRDFITETWGDMKGAFAEMSEEEDFAAKMNILFAVTGYGKFGQDMLNMLKQYVSGEWDKNEQLYYSLQQDYDGTMAQYTKVTDADVKKYVNDANGEYEAREHARALKEKEFHNKVQDALKQMDSRIMDAALALMEYDDATAERLTDAIASDGFDRNDVVCAIKEVQKKLEPDKEYNDSEIKEAYFRSTTDMQKLAEMAMSDGYDFDTAVANAKKVRAALQSPPQSKTDKDIDGESQKPINQAFVNGEIDIDEARRLYKGFTTFDDANINSHLIDRVDERYANGGMTLDEAKQMYLDLGVKESKASEKLGKIVTAAYENKKYSSKDEAVAEYMKYTGEEDREIASIKFDYDDLKEQDEKFPLKYEQYSTYRTKGLDDAGITVDAYAGYLEQASGMSTSTAGEKEKAFVARQKKFKEVQAQKLPLINKMDLTREQKDALYLSEWKETNLRYAPWNNPSFWSGMLD